MKKFCRYIRLAVILFIEIIVLVSCSNQTPKIPISNTLELALGTKYNSYVDLLNKSVGNDTIALLEILKIDNINDAAGYDHGYILYKLLESIGDRNFSNVLRRLNPQEKLNFVNYFEVGMDAHDNLKSEYKSKYPLSYDLITSSK